MFDIDAELAAEAEAPINEAADAAPTSNLDIADHLTQAAADTSPKLIALMKRAVKSLKLGDNAAATKLAFKALNLAPDHAMPNHVMALCLTELGRLSSALTFFERAWKLDPKNPEIYMNLGHTAWKLDMLDASEKFFRIYVEMAPTELNGVVNLGGVLRDQGKFEASIEILRAAIYANPESALLWNALGTTLLDTGDLAQAETFYCEALRLQPTFSRVHHNLAFVKELAGEADAAIAHFKEALKAPDNPTDEVTMTHGLSLASLTGGYLKEGWDLYAVRLNPLYVNATLFNLDLPMWDGTDLAKVRGETLLVIGEQGLGDEVLFLEMLGDLIDAVGPDGEVRVACEARLRPLVQRSFPEVMVDRHFTIAREGREIRATPRHLEDDKVTMWTPMGQPARTLRQSISAFSGKAFFTPDPVRVQEFCDQLNAMGPGLKAGLLWKSLKMTAKRSKSYSPFEAWKPVLNLDGVTFVNLQYGDAEEDLERARTEFGVDIQTIEGLDLKDDLAGVAALCAALDVVMGPMNATTNLAAAVGAQTWLVHSRPKAWTMLGENHLPWYPNARSYTGAHYRDFTGIMRALASDLQLMTSKAA